ncbi:hypothetical protein DSO57_1012157 [Entomophthora muscae]|uniref:Uncharacterized protein n=1 Tax=Entomophthora muscae TaxID=34485 RepID=A0ACC2SV21_9FUNG|nr:hypothetical protein DSO57_1012157 [Entomophthora muscae]
MVQMQECYEKDFEEAYYNALFMEQVQLKKDTPTQSVPGSDPGHISVASEEKVHHNNCKFTSPFGFGLHYFLLLHQEKLSNTNQAA